MREHETAEELRWRQLQRDFKELKRLEAEMLRRGYLEPEDARLDHED